MPKRQVFWQGTVPAYDDFTQKIENEFIDGKTQMGPWAFMTPTSFRSLGVGLGLGKGQRYVKQSDGQWLKVEG